MGNDPETLLGPLALLQYVEWAEPTTTCAPPPKCANVLVRDPKLSNASSMTPRNKIKNKNKVLKGAVNV